MNAEQIKTAETLQSLADNATKALELASFMGARCAKLEKELKKEKARTVKLLDSIATIKSIADGVCENVHDATRITFPEGKFAVYSKQDLVKKLSFVFHSQVHILSIIEDVENVAL